MTLLYRKVGIYVYSDNSLRVVVSTANLYYEDWNYYCQGYARKKRLLDHLHLACLRSKLTYLLVSRFSYLIPV